MPNPAAGSQLPVAAEIELIMNDDIRQRLAERSVAWRGSASEPPDPASVVPGRIVRRAALAGRRRVLANRSVCTAVRSIASEIMFLIGAREQSGRQRRFATSHVRQIAIYVCHVVLQLTMTEIALAFGVDRTTVGHACARVEDRRDDKAYDALVASVERIVGCLFGRAGTGRA